MKTRMPARFQSLRSLAVLIFVLLLAACHAGQAEQREAAADPASPVTASAPAVPVAMPVAATSATPTAQVTAVPESRPVLAAADQGRSCKTDADCAVKDVGSCCGYHPQCLNKDTPTFPDEVKARCAREGRVSTCGMLAISGCQCVSGKCENVLQSDESLPAAPAELK